MREAPVQGADAVHAVVGHQPVGERVERDGRQYAGHDQAAIQRVHDLAALARLDEEGADDGGDDGEAAQHQRIDHGIGTGIRHQQAAEQHGGDDGHRVGLEQVGRHAGAVADVVAHVVGDHGRVARVVFGDACFDFADQVGADVSALGEDAAAETGEDGDQRTAEAQADQCMRRLGRGCAHVGEERVIASDPEQSQAHHQHAGDRAAFERDVERGIEAFLGGFGGAHIGAHRDVHADEARCAREQGADGETDGSLPAERNENGDEQHHADDGDGGILPLQVGGGAFLYRSGDALHLCATGRFAQYPLA